MDNPRDNTPQHQDNPFDVPEGSRVGRSARFVMGASNLTFKHILKHLADQDRETIGSFHSISSALMGQAQVVADILNPTPVKNQSVILPAYAHSPWAMKVRQFLERDFERMAPPVNYIPVSSQSYWRPRSKKPIGAEWFTLNANFTYSPTNQQIVSVDKSAQCVLYFHGGAFITGSSSWVIYKDFVKSLLTKIYDTQLARSLRSGLYAPKPRPIVCLSVDYSLVPNAPFPIAVQEGVAAYEYLVESLRLDPSQIILGGDSAGGTIAAAVTLALQRIGAPTPGGLVLFSPWLDLSLSGSSVKELKQSDPLLPAEAAPTCVRALLSVVKTNRGNGLQTGFTHFPFPKNSKVNEEAFPELPVYAASHPSISKIINNPQLLQVTDAEKSMLQKIGGFGNNNSGGRGFGDFYNSPDEFAQSITNATKYGMYQIEKHPLVSPLFASRSALRKLPPTLLVAGGREILLDDSTRFFQALCTARTTHSAFDGSLTSKEDEGKLLSKYREWLRGKIKSLDQHPLGQLAVELGLREVLIEESERFLESLSEAKDFTKDEVLNLIDELQKQDICSPELKKDQVSPKDFIRQNISNSLQEKLNLLVSDINQFKNHVIELADVAKHELSEDAKKNVEELFDSLEEKDNQNYLEWSSKSLLDEKLGANKLWHRIESESESANESLKKGLFKSRYGVVNPITFVSVPAHLEDKKSEIQEDYSNQALKAVIDAETETKLMVPPSPPATTIAPSNGFDKDFASKSKIHQLTVWPGMMHVFSLFGSLTGFKEAGGAVNIATEFITRNIWPDNDVTSKVEGKDSSVQSGAQTPSNK